MMEICLLYENTYATYCILKKRQAIDIISSSFPCPGIDYSLAFVYIFLVQSLYLMEILHKHYFNIRYIHSFMLTPMFIYHIYYTIQTLIWNSKLFNDLQFQLIYC